MATEKHILTESGTNELEVVMFQIGDQTFGINVLKVREIIQPLPITTIPKSHEHIKGVIHLRGEIIPVIDLRKVLHISPKSESERDKIIISQFNQIFIAFHVHHVERIYRLSWEQIEKPHEISTGASDYTLGMIPTGDDMAILLDFEKILVEIYPEAGIHSSQLQELGIRERSKKKIIVAEDSPILRKMLGDTLHEAGYDHVKFFEHGQLAWEYLEKLANNEQLDPKDNIHLIITDIEMPQMDGHHLTKRIKNHSKLQHLPVIIFSSLISESLYHKGKRVGADAQITKPEIIHLVEAIDRLIL